MIARLTTTTATSMKLIKLLLITIAFLAYPNIAIAETYTIIPNTSEFTVSEDQLYLTGEMTSEEGVKFSFEFYRATLGQLEGMKQTDHLRWYAQTRLTIKAPEGITMNSITFAEIPGITDEPTYSYTYCKEFTLGELVGGSISIDSVNHSVSWIGTRPVTEFIATSDNGQISANKIVITAEGDPEIDWVELGKGKYIDPLISLWYYDTDLPVDVTIYEDANKNGLYKIVGVWPYCMNDGTGTIIIDASNPNCVIIPNQFTGINDSTDGKVYIASYSALKMEADGISSDGFVANYNERNITLKDGIITLPYRSILINWPESTELNSNGEPIADYWYPGKNMDGLVALPGSSYVDPWSDIVEATFLENVLYPFMLDSENVNPVTINIRKNFLTSQYCIYNPWTATYDVLGYGHKSPQIVIDASNPDDIIIDNQFTGLHNASVGTYFLYSQSYINKSSETTNEYPKIILKDNSDGTTTITFEPNSSMVYGDASKQYYEASKYTSVLTFKTILPSSEIKLSTPEIRFDAGKVEITCVDTEGKIYYTLDGSTPTTESTRYTGTFGIDRNYPIRAIAVAEGKLDSDIAEYTPSYFRCEPPTYTYDGHYLTLHTPLEDGKISFYIENSYNYGDPQYYNGIEIDMVESYTWMRQYNKLYAHVEAPYMNNSETLTFDPPYYCWKETYGRYTTTIVDLRQGLEGKMSDILKSDDISRIESLYVMGDINTSDLATMRNMPLIWLYLEGATFLDEHLPDNAFSIETLRCVTVPHNFITAGRELFKNAKELCSVRWVNRPDEPILTLDMLGVQHNPNLVIRTNYPDPSLNEIKNIIDLGDKSQANIVLTDGYPFEIAVSPNTYVIDVVGSITYKRSFTQRSGYGENAAGWETLILPFDVDEITYNGMVITPFDGTVNDAEGHHFWLYMFDGNGWTRATEIKKGLPYIMSVPNNAVYEERWNIPGEYTFSASNNWLSTRAEYSYFGSRIPDFSYFGQPASSDVYALNTYDISTSNAPGSVFLPGHKDVRPFEWYFTDENSPSRISIFGDFSGLENVYADMTDATGLEVSAKGGVLRIVSERDRTVRIVNMTGTVIKTVDVRAGQPATVDDLAHGFYIVENIKVVL